MLPARWRKDWICCRRRRNSTGADADILLWEPDLTLDTFVAGGEIFMKDGKVVKKGTYE